MVASSLEDDQGTAVHPYQGLGVLPVAAIYGANAAGKSNVLSALEFMKTAVTDSRRKWNPEGPIPLDPFLLDPEHRDDAARFEVDVIIEGVRYRYGFELDRAIVRKEWLSAYPHRREQAWFTRDAARAEPFKFGKYFKGGNRAIAALTRTNSLFLSAAAENNGRLALPIYSWFSNRVELITPQLQSLHLSIVPPVFQDDALRSRAIQLVKAADLGIVDAKVKEIPLDEHRFQKAKEFARFVEWDFDADEAKKRLDRGLLRVKELEFQHRAKLGSISFPLAAESNGTLAWIFLVATILRVLDTGSVLCIDELDASLHPHLALEIIRMFQDPKRNPRHAQLIFNTHDIVLLGNLAGGPHLRRDQVWFVEKDSDGATHLYPLTDFKPRKDENLERGYLQGRYGAVPFIDFASTVGLG